MARKSSANSESTHGFNDLIGLGLLVFAFLLLVGVYLIILGIAVAAYASLLRARDADRSKQPE